MSIRHSSPTNDGIKSAADLYFDRLQKMTDEVLPDYVADNFGEDVSLVMERHSASVRWKLLRDGMEFKWTPWIHLYMVHGEERMKAVTDALDTLCSS